MHPILILVGKICLDIFPGMTQQASWTIVTLGYLAVNPNARPIPITFRG